MKNKNDKRGKSPANFYDRIAEMLGKAAIPQTITVEAEGVSPETFSAAGITKRELYATVGQYTGLKDKNGKEIYEGDIINWLMHRMDRTGYIEEGRVEFRTNEQATVVINKFATKDGRESVRNILNCLNDLKVIGNIHDNPELMKGGDQ